MAKKYTPEILCNLVGARGPISAEDIAKDLKVKTYQIKVSLSKLIEKGVIKQDEKGKYLLGSVTYESLITCPDCGYKAKNENGLIAHKKWHCPYRPKESETTPEDEKEEELFPESESEKEPEPDIPPIPHYSEHKEPPVPKRNSQKEDDPGIVSKKEGQRSSPSPKLTQEDAGVTPYQQFLIIGKKVGLTPDLVDLTADAVFSNGNYSNPDSVWKNMSQMVIRPDLKERFYWSWLSYLEKTELIPGEFIKERGTAVQREGEPPVPEKPKKVREGFDYILDLETWLPRYVGEGLGDYKYDDAKELSKIKLSRGSAGEVKKNVDEMDIATKMLTFVEKATGLNRPPKKNYLVTTDEMGNPSVEEIDPDAPMVVPPPQMQRSEPPPQYVVDTAKGEVRTVKPGEPIVITPPPLAPPAAAPAKTYLVNSQTGKVEEYQSGQPIVIVQQPPVQQGGGLFGGTPIQLNDENGKPIVMDLKALMDFTSYKKEEARKDESHKAKMEMFGTLKDFATKLANAAANSNFNQGK